MSNSLMTPAASLAVGPLEAAVIATIRNASLSGAAFRHLSTRQRNADAVEREGLPLSFSGIYVQRGRRRQTPAPHERQTRRNDVIKFPSGKVKRPVKLSSSIFTILAFYFRLAAFPRCCASRSGGAYSVSSCGCLAAAAL